MHGYHGISLEVDSHGLDESNFHIEILDMATHHEIIHWAFHLIDVNREAGGPIRAKISVQNGFNEESVALLRRWLPAVTSVRFDYCAATAHMGAEATSRELEQLKKFDMTLWPPERDTMDIKALRKYLRMP
ncbi:hypothetical protein FRB98_007496 [Tulasnella sp. 332]|nr:hypothetical protein FRB98_007496 [Tulasnella sp. 332]